MAYSLVWRSPALPYVQKQTAISVPAGAIVSNASSLRFTGKGATNYGKIQQENLMRLLENFAGPTEPPYATVGETWYDTSSALLKVCVSTAPDPVTWRSVGGVQVTNVGEPAPTPASLGDQWFQRTGASSGILYIYTGIGRYPNTSSTVGGWDQVYPTVQRAAGREEYDYVLGLVLQLIGSPTSTGGSGALGKSIQYLTALSTLDTSMQNAWTARTPVDAQILSNVANLAYLKVEPDSQDWDKLLAAAKYAINRLELPVNMYTDVSTYPFVIDGRQAPAVLTTLSPSDPQFPDIARMSNSKPGTVTLVRNFQETINVLLAAVDRRAAIRGIYGTSGTNTAFSSNVSGIALGPTFSYTGQFTTTVTHSFRVKFLASSDDDVAFFGAGQALEMRFTHPGTSTSSDVDLKTIADNTGRFRVTTNELLVMTGATSTQLAEEPIAKGYSFIAAGPGTVTLRTLTVGSATVSLKGAYGLVTGSGSDYKYVTLNLEITTTGATTGTTTATTLYISDNETYSGSTRVYAAPMAYISGDKAGPFA